MDDDDRRTKERRQCDPTTCRYHALTDAVIQDLKTAIQKIMEGQEQMKETVIQLAEAFKYMDRLERRLEKLEKEKRKKEKEISNKFENINKTLYKATGVMVALLFIGELVLRFFLGG